MGGRVQTRWAGLLLLASGAAEFTALGFPVVRRQPALGTDDAGFVVQVLLGTILVGAGLFCVRRREPFDRGLAVGVGAFVAGRLVLLPAGLASTDGTAGVAFYLLLSATAGAVVAAVAAWSDRGAERSHAQVLLVAAAAVLGAGAYAFDPSRGAELILDGVSWVDTGIAVEIVAAAAVPIAGHRMGLFGAGMASGGAAVLATTVAGTIALDEGLGLGWWCAVAGALALVGLAFVVARDT